MLKIYQQLVDLVLKLVGGKGLGKKLLIWLEEKAIKKGSQIIWFAVMDKYPQAFQFYKKQGYIYIIRMYFYLTSYCIAR